MQPFVMCVTFNTLRSYSTMDTDKPDIVEAWLANQALERLQG